MWHFSLFSEGSAALAANINLEPQGALQPPIHPTTSLTVPCASCFEGNEFQIVLIRLSHFNSHALPFFGGHCFDLSVTQPLPNPPSLSSSSDCECPNQPIVQLQSGPKAHTALAGTKVLQNKEKMAPAPVVETIPTIGRPHNLFLGGHQCIWRKTRMRWSSRGWGLDSIAVSLFGHMTGGTGKVLISAKECQNTRSKESF